MPDTQNQTPEDLRDFTSLWRAKIRLGLDHRKKFDQDAAAARKYFDGAHNFVFGESEARKSDHFKWTGEKGGFKAPDVQMTFNKVFEFVSIFGPLLYHRNPVRTAEPKRFWTPPEDISVAQQQPMPGASPLTQQMAGAQQMASPDKTIADQHFKLAQATGDLLAKVLNYTPNEFRLKEHQRLCIDEALVTGRGCLRLEMHQPTGSERRLPRHIFMSNKDLAIDPDHASMEDAKWIAVRRVRPIWEKEREGGWEPGELRGTLESTDTTSAIESNKKVGDEKKKGKTADLIVYWEVWSKMGLGPRLKPRNMSEDTPLESIAIGKMSSLTERFGDFVYMEVADNVSHPINLPPKLADAVMNMKPELLDIAMQPPPPPQPQTNEFGQPVLDPMTQQPVMIPVAEPPEIVAARQAIEEFKARVAWPIPVLAFDDTWPVTPTDFRPLYDHCWPLNLLAPAMGQQDFLDWGYSMMASKMRTTHRDILAVALGLDPEQEEIITHGPDMSVVKFKSSNQNLDQQVKWLQAPQMNRDNYEVMQLIERNFEKSTGLSQEMYGMPASPADRSAQASAMKGQAMQIRPDDMAERVESAATQCARKEALALRTMCKGQDVEPIIGPIGAQFWDREVYTQDYERVCREFDYRIEAGSARKPNKDKEIADMDTGAQFILPVLKEFAGMTGNFTPFVGFLKRWAEVRDYDVGEWLIDPTQAMQQMQMMQQQQAAQAPPAEGGAPPPEGQQPMPAQQPMMPQQPATDPALAQILQGIYMVLQNMVALENKGPEYIIVPPAPAPEKVKPPKQAVVKKVSEDTFVYQESEPVQE